MTKHRLCVPIPAKQTEKPKQNRKMYKASGEIRTVIGLFVATKEILLIF